MTPPINIDGESGYGNVTIDGQTVEQITIDGQDVLSTILGLYLDDFEDGKFNNRDTYSETTLTPPSLEPSSSNYSSAERPEWTFDDSGGFSISNGILFLSDTTDYLMRSELNISWDSETVYELRVTRTNQASNNGADQYVLGMDGTSFINQDNGNNDSHYTSGRYQLYLNDGGRNQCTLEYVSSGGSSDTIVQGNAFNLNETQDFRIVRSSGGSWEFFQNGSSQGTGNHTDLTSPSYIAITGDSRATIEVPHFKVY